MLEQTPLCYSVLSLKFPSSHVFPLNPFHCAFVFAPSSPQIAGALSAVVILFITLWIGTLFEDLPKVLLQEQKKKKLLRYSPWRLFNNGFLANMQPAVSLLAQSTSVKCELVFGIVGGACWHHLRQPAWDDEAVYGHSCTVEDQQSRHGELTGEKE